MPKEYRTIEEVAGPLMLVRGVENVFYDELGEIELANGERRRCKVLEIDGGNALVQLFEASTGINLSNSRVRFLGRSMELGVSADMLGRVFDGWAGPLTTALRSCPKSVWISTACPSTLRRATIRRSLSRPGSRPSTV